MREILFRGKTKQGEWVQGDLSQHKTGKRFIKCGSATSSFEVIPETIGQYTGLTDKNGTKIFEGDILSIARKSDGIGSYYYPPLKYPVNVFVCWDMCAWCWETICKEKYYICFPDAWCHFECEIIGNIHDNPELLEGSVDNASKN